MTDIAALGLSIDSSPAVDAAKNLDKLSDAAGRAEAAVKKLPQPAVDAGRTYDSLGNAVEYARQTFRKTEGASVLLAKQTAATAGVTDKATVSQAKQVDSADVLAGKLRALGSAVAVIDGPLGGVASRFQSFGSVIGRVGFQIGALLLVTGALTLALRRVFGDYLRETVEAEYAAMRLNTVLKSTGGVSGMTRESLDDLAKSLRAVTGFSDNSIKSAQGLLLQFTNIGRTIFPRATEAALDMATALGTDASTAARQIGRALQDPIRGVQSLSEAGVQFTEAQKEMIAGMVRAGAGAKAQELILQQLEERFGGTARAAQNTLGGALSDLSNAWKELLKVVGPAAVTLREAIQRLADALGSEKFRTFANQVGSAFFNAISAAVDALTALAGILPTATKLLLTFGAAWASVAAPGLILASATAIATWAAGTTVAVTTLGMAFRVFAAGALALVVGGLQGVVLGLRAVAVAVAANPLGALVSVAVAGYVSFRTWRTEMNDLVNLGIVKFKSLGESATKAANLIIGAFNLAFKNIRDGFKTINPLNWFKDGPSFAEMVRDNARTSLGRDYIAEAEAATNASRNQTAVPADRPAQMPDGANAFNAGSDNAYDRAIQQSRERTAQLQAETETLGKSILIQQQHLQTLALEAAAKEAGVALSGKVQAQIKAEADAYAQAAAQRQWQQSIQAANDNYRALKDEIALIGKYGFELAYASEQQRLLNDAKQAGIQITPAIEALIDALSRRNAVEATYLDIMRQSEKVVRDALSTFVKDIASGTSAVEALGNALKNIGNILIDIGVRNLVGAAFGGLNGLLGGGGSMPGFASGGYTGGSKGRVAGVVHGEEFVINADATRTYRPLLEAINAGRVANINTPARPPSPSSSKPASLTFAPVINLSASGGNPDELIAAARQKLLPEMKRLAQDATVQMLERSGGRF